MTVEVTEVFKCIICNTETPRTREGRYEGVCDNCESNAVYAEDLE